MRIIQFEDPTLGRCLGVVREQAVYNITGINPHFPDIHSAFQVARPRGLRIEDWLQHLLNRNPEAPTLSYPELLESGRMLAPVIEEKGMRMLVSGTGLTHTGSVQQRDAMHQAARAQVETGPKSDSRKMFEMGLAGGRPAAGQRGAAPEWFYKGDGRILRGPRQSLDIPSFAPDGGEEPEVVGVYVVDENGIPCRLGFAQGNEWSDHVTENVNYLYLAPSKLRSCAIGPELVTDLAFADLRGRCRVWRDDRIIYDSGELLTGERNMCHSLANLEDHLFKYPQHRCPGDIHIHYFGTSKLSFQHREWKYQTGDLVEVAFEDLGAPLCNPVRRLEPSEVPIAVELG